MTRKMLKRRLRAKTSDERGFTLLETIIAITVIFGSLTTLAYAATASLHYQDIARQRQSANGVAAQIMEEVRGLAYTKITAGLSSTDLTGDSNIVSCSGVYRFLACTAGSEPGAGEKIVSSAGLTTTTPLVPHQSSTSPNTDVVINNIAYSWATYVTQDDSSATSPYRVTVVVTWTDGPVGGTKLVRVQSLFWSPNGCTSTATHPFAAPCQPFYLGNATVPNGNLSVTGSIAGTSFSGTTISLMGASATVQQEQIPSAETAVHPVEGSITDPSTTSAGGVTVAADADGDPNTSALSYARQRCGIEVTCSGGTLTGASSGDGQTYVTLNVPSTSTGEADSVTSATSTYTCPPSLISSTTQTDALPCAGAAAQQSDLMMAVAHLNSFADIGDANLLRVFPSNANQATALVDRVMYPAPSGAGCTPAAGTDGCIASSAARSYGNVRIGGFPDRMNFPSSVNNTNCVAGDNNFYLINLIGYTGSAKVAAGYGAPAPVANAPGGRLYYFNPATGGCSSLDLSSSSITGLNSSYSTTQSVDGTNVTVSMSTVASQTIAASQSSTTTAPSSGGATYGFAQAQCVSPIITMTYSISVPGTTLMSVTETINLGTLSADATYAPAPSGA